MLGSVIHQHRNEMVMKSFGVQTVYHAAAYKHVPLVEHNPIEGIRNNAFGTRHMAEAALAAGVETFVLISTDKAVRPTNVMGASKRLAELVLQALARGRGDAFLHGALRQCARLLRFGGAAVSQPDRGGRADHADPRRHHALFHDHPRGGATGDSGGLDGPGRRSLCAGHGQAG